MLAAPVVDAATHAGDAAATVAAAAVAVARDTATGTPPDERSAEIDARILRRTHFGGVRDRRVREAGYDAIRRISGAEPLLATAAALSDEADDVRGVLLEHLADSGRPGQLVLAWLAIADDDPRLRGAAAMRLEHPPAPVVVDVARAALRGGTAAELDRAAELAAWLGAIELLPALVDRLAVVRGRRMRPSAGIGFSGYGLARTFDAGGGVLPVPLLTRSGTVLSAGGRPVRVRRWLEPRPAVHRAVLVLARRLAGPDAPDHGYDAARWREWIAEITPAGPPRP